MIASGLAVAALLGSLNATGAHADPISDKRAQAEQVAAELDRLEQRLSELDEQFNAAQLRLAEIEADIANAEARAAEASTELASTEEQVRRFAIESYISSGDADTLDALVGGDMEGLGTRQAYASVATGSRTDLLEDLSLRRERADAEAADLEAVRAEASAVEAELAGARQQADEAVAEQDDVRRRVEGELAALVAEEQARRAAEERRRAEEAARQEAARQAALARTTTTTAPRTGPVPTAPGGRVTTTTTTPPDDDDTAPPVLPPPGGDVSAVLAAASTQIGTPYVWAGSSPETGFDCSGFTMWAWSHGGRSLPHSAAAQMGMTRRISRSQLQPGDLVFYGSPVHHVAIYVGNNTIVHAPGRGKFVRYDSVDYWSAYAGAGRL